MADPHPTVDPSEPPVTQPPDDPNATLGGQPFPPDTLPAPSAAGRYALGDEIARGGMGAVYRATDTVLDREVAVKVLQEKYGPASGPVRRFNDEARISARLQHPAIPPVHDLGTLPDGRPFLTMKLIHGQTLDDMLKGRPDPSTDRGRFVAAFEQIAQAVAFAHSQAIIHRDLKPANVMVGSYGEVQVMDWGLAKVLASGGRQAPVEAAPDADPDATQDDRWPEATQPPDHTPAAGSTDDRTHAGQVMGTPAYMPPEQARGEVDRVDRRSDVFALGGILCAILTGEPPYVGRGVTAFQKAAAGDLDDANTRLDACGAEPELVALCKRCLSPDPADRPADAGEVTAAVAALRQAADERVRQAELDKVRVEGEAVAERVKAAERRKRRRAGRVGRAMGRPPRRRRRPAAAADRRFGRV